MLTSGSNSTTSYTYDAFGNLTSVTLPSTDVIDYEIDGTVAGRMDHDEYGRVTVNTNPGLLPFGFAGGLYDSETGRWTSKDPILFGGNMANLYGYTFSDPVNFVDPSGHFGIVGGTVGFVAGAYGGYVAGGFWGGVAGAAGAAAVAAAGVTSVAGEAGICIAADSATSAATAPFTTGPVDLCRVISGKPCYLHNLFGVK